MLIQHTEDIYIGFTCFRTFYSNPKYYCLWQVV